MDLPQKRPFKRPCDVFTYTSLPYGCDSILTAGRTYDRRTTHITHYLRETYRTLTGIDRCATITPTLLSTPTAATGSRPTVFWIADMCRRSATRAVSCRNPVDCRILEHRRGAAEVSSRSQPSSPCASRPSRDHSFRYAPLVGISSVSAGEVQPATVGCRTLLPDGRHLMRHGPGGPCGGHLHSIRLPYTCHGTTNGGRKSRERSLLAASLNSPTNRSVSGSIVSRAPRVAGVLSRSMPLASRWACMAS